MNIRSIPLDTILKRRYTTDSKGVTHCTLKLRDASGRITYTTVY